MKFLRDVSSTLIGQAIGLAVVLGVNVLVARAWGPEGKGTYSLLMNTASIIMLLVNLGLSQAAIYFLGKGKYELQEVTENLITSGLLLSLGTTLILWILFAVFIGRWFQGMPTLFPSLVIIVVPSMIFRLYLSHLFVSQGMFTWYAGINVVDSIVQLLLLGGVALMHMSFVWALAAYAVSTILVTALGWSYFVLRHVGLHLRLRLTRSMLTELVQYGLRSYSVSILTRLNLRFDQFLLVFFLNVGSVGVYSVAVALAELATRIGSAMTMVLFDRAAKEQDSQSISITSSSLRFSISVAVVISIGLLLCTPWLIHLLFGPAFLDGVWALILLLPGTILMNAERVLHGFFYGSGKPEYNLYSSLLAVAIMLVGNFFLTPWLGINGAAIASTLAYSASAFLLLYLYQRFSHQSMWTMFWINREEYSSVSVTVRQLLARRELT